MSFEVRAPAWLPPLPAPCPYRITEQDRNKETSRSISIVRTFVQNGKLVLWGTGTTCMLASMPLGSAILASFGLGVFVNYAPKCIPGTKKDIDKVLKKIEDTKNLLISGVDTTNLIPGERLKVEIVSGRHLDHNEWDAWYDMQSHSINIRDDIPLDFLPDAMLFAWAAAVQRGRMVAINDQMEQGRHDVKEAKDYVAQEIKELGYAYEKKYYDCFCFKWVWDVVKEADKRRLFKFGISNGEKQLLKFRTTLKHIPLAPAESPQYK